MKLRAIALIGFLFVLTVAANAQATRADLPAPDNFLGIATFPLWDGDAPGALGKEQADVPTITLFRSWPANSNGNGPGVLQADFWLTRPAVSQFLVWS